MIKFTYDNLVIGPLIEGHKMTIVFPYEGEINIKEMTSSCGCSFPIHDQTNKQIKLEYTAQDVPFHLLAKGEKSYKTTKKVTIIHIVDGVEETKELTFTATVHSKKKN